MLLSESNHPKHRVEMAQFLFLWRGLALGSSQRRGSSLCRSVPAASAHPSTLREPVRASEPVLRLPKRDGESLSCTRAFDCDFLALGVRYNSKASPSCFSELLLERLSWWCHHSGTGWGLRSPSVSTDQFTALMLSRVYLGPGHEASSSRPQQQGQRETAHARHSQQSARPKKRFSP